MKTFTRGDTQIKVSPGGGGGNDLAKVLPSPPDPQARSPRLQPPAPPHRSQHRVGALITVQVCTEPGSSLSQHSHAAELLCSIPAARFPPSPL